LLAHAKHLEFFGRVKDKAGDMERILKEKDKHGNVGFLVLRDRIAVVIGKKFGRSTSLALSTMTLCFKKSYKIKA
jgi:hypothetical protein